MAGILQLSAQGRPCGLQQNVYKILQLIVITSILWQPVYSNWGEAPKFIFAAFL